MFCTGLFWEVRPLPGVSQTGRRQQMDAGAQDRGRDSKQMSPVSGTSCYCCKLLSALIRSFRWSHGTLQLQERVQEVGLKFREFYGPSQHYIMYQLLCHSNNICLLMNTIVSVISGHKEYFRSCMETLHSATHFSL